jgi:dTDP-glucose 4,6-dehydratase
MKAKLIVKGEEVAIVKMNCHMHADAIRSILDERVASNLEMGLQSHQKAETKVSVPNKNTISSYKDLINNIINATKLETQLGWKANETFDTGIVKSVEWYLGKYE